MLGAVLHLLSELPNCRLPWRVKNYAKKPNLVLKIVSHCTTVHQREKYIQELGKYTQVTQGIPVLTLTGTK